MQITAKLFTNKPATVIFSKPSFVKENDKNSSLTHLHKKSTKGKFVNVLLPSKLKAQCVSTGMKLFRHKSDKLRDSGI
jgi:hypothetical protein